jgi:SAM-dependent methyltransferase
LLPQTAHVLASRLNLKPQRRQANDLPPAKKRSWAARILTSAARVSNNFFENFSMLVGQMELDAITARTLADYDRSADAFREGTQNHDVSQNITAMLTHIRAAPPFVLLDFGCGPGRDLKILKALGHRPIGLDGSERFVAMARESSGCEVWQQDFLALSLPLDYFDGVFANAALFHVPRQELPRVLAQLHGTLKTDGVLMSSNPRGNDEEGWRRNRYGVFHSLESWRRFMTQAGFTELAHYYRPAGLPREQQPWLASVWRKSRPIAA